MSNEQLIAYLLSIVNALNSAILQTMDNINPERITYPVLDPILEVKESLYEQIEALKGIKQ